MFEFVSSGIMLVILFMMIMVAFFAFDNLIMGGVFGRALKRYAEDRYENGCNNDCNQGRNCNCVKNNVEKE